MNKIFKNVFFLLLFIHFASFQGMIIRTLHLPGDCCISHLYAIIITEFSAGLSTGSGPSGITAGPDGNVWFTENNASKIGKITPDGTITEFSIPTASSEPLGITEGPDGNLWFTEGFGNNIGRITTAGVITEFPIPTSGSSPHGITAGPVSDGKLWFTETLANKIGRIPTAGAIVITEFPIPTSDSAPLGITLGPDGNLWFTESKADKIGQITTAGVIMNEFTLASGSAPQGITLGPDGNLWFTEKLGNNIGRITPEGAITEFSIPTSDSGPFDITAGPDGNLWFTESLTNQIGQITTSGVITEFPIPAPGSAPEGITKGPDDNLWFALFSNAIGKITQFRTTTTTLTTVTPNPATFGQSVTLTATVTPSTASPPLTGTVEFLDGGVSIGVVTLSGDQATLIVNTFTAGIHSLTAEYNGDENFMSSTSSPPVILTVNQASTTTTLTVAPNPATFGQSVTLMATVTPSTASPPLTGTVEFLDGGVSIGVVTLSGDQATLIVNTFTAGIHSLTAEYNGDENFMSSTSSPPVILTVNQASTTTTLTVAPNPATFGQSVTLMASVAPSASTGTMQFFDGGVFIGTGTLSGGKATLTVNSFAVGAHSLTAVYSGDSNFVGSTSYPVFLTVRLIATTTKLVVEPKPVKRNQTVTLTVSITPSSATGSVTFYSNCKLLGVATVSNGQATLTTCFPHRGKKSLIAYYSGANQFIGSISNSVVLSVGRKGFQKPDHGCQFFAYGARGVVY